MIEKNYRVNERIKFSPIVLIDQDGENLGVIPLNKAKGLALSYNLDLVEVSPNSKPPVCRIMDFGKFKYEQEIKRKKQSKKSVQTKEIRLSCRIADNDLDVKAKLANKFLLSGNKVYVKLEFKRRENDHKELGYIVMNNFISKLEENSIISNKISLEGRSLSCLLDPKKPE